MSTPKEIELFDAEFAMIQKLVFANAGITLDDTKKSLVKNRLSKRLKFYGLAKYSDYIRVVQFNANEATEMVNLITTNETYFFRETAHFDFLKKFSSEQNSSKYIRVWSAAASLGAEAYSIAMVLDSIVGASRFDILGTDINTEVLNVARRGRYPISFADKIEMQYKQAYCLKGKNQFENQLLIDPELQKKVTFQQANLLENQANLGKFDLIFLRNVLIYFNDEVKKIVVENVIKNLNPGGYLIISLTENLRNVKVDSLQQVSTSIFQKVD